MCLAPPRGTDCCIFRFIPADHDPSREMARGPLPPIGHHRRQWSVPSSHPTRRKNRSSLTSSPCGGAGRQRRRLSKHRRRSPLRPRCASQVATHSRLWTQKQRQKGSPPMTCPSNFPRSISFRFYTIKVLDLVLGTVRRAQHPKRRRRLPLLLLLPARTCQDPASATSRRQSPFRAQAGHRGHRMPLPNGMSARQHRLERYRR